MSCRGRGPRVIGIRPVLLAGEHTSAALACLTVQLLVHLFRQGQPRLLCHEEKEKVYLKGSNSLTWCDKMMFLC